MTKTTTLAHIEQLIETTVETEIELKDNCFEMLGLKNKGNLVWNLESFFEI